VLADPASTRPPSPRRCTGSWSTCSGPRRSATAQGAAHRLPASLVPANPAATCTRTTGGPGHADVLGPPGEVPRSLGGLAVLPAASTLGCRRPGPARSSRGGGPRLRARRHTRLPLPYDHAPSRTDSPHAGLGRVPIPTRRPAGPRRNGVGPHGVEMGFTALLGDALVGPVPCTWRSSTTAATAPGLLPGRAVAPRHVRELTPRSLLVFEVTSIPFVERTVRVRNLRRRGPFDRHAKRCPRARGT